MSNYIKILFFVVFIFLLNVLLFFFNKDYKFFIKKLKNPGNNIYVDEKDINDNLSFSDSIIEEKYIDIISDKRNKLLLEKEKNKVKNILKNDIDKEININTRKVELEEKLKNIIKEEENKKEIKQEIYLGKQYLNILDLFKKYDTYKIKIHTSLFDLTNEYPNKYFEFYSDEVTIYFFPIGSYKEMYEIFDVLTYDLPFSIKEVDNFGDKSFYINLDEEVSDNNIRFIISNKGILFGVKVQNDEYNNIKKILDFNLKK